MSSTGCRVLDVAFIRRQMLRMNLILDYKLKVLRKIRVMHLIVSLYLSNNSLP